VSVVAAAASAATTLQELATVHDRLPPACVRRLTEKQETSLPPGTKKAVPVIAAQIALAITPKTTLSPADGKI